MRWTALHPPAAYASGLSRRRAWKQVVTIGLDIAKSVFQVHGVDADGAVVLRQRLPRSRMLAFFEKQAPCLVGLEACGSAHYWGRELSAWATRCA